MFSRSQLFIVVLSTLINFAKYEVKINQMNKPNLWNKIETIYRPQKTPRPHRSPEFQLSTDE